MTVVKICGVTNKDDCRLASDLGADAIGLNFVTTSPRYISSDRAQEIIESVGRDVSWVGVFVNESKDNIFRIVENLKLDAIQLHGEESPEFADEIERATGCKIIKAFRVSDKFELETITKFRVSAVLLDAFSNGAHGGTGQRFDWSIAKAATGLCDSIYLAGGLNPANIAEAIRYVRPYAVDVCSGVEVSPGKKDRAKLKALFSAVNEVK
jgi:phosphoribosylanthranilate isomerase